MRLMSIKFGLRLSVCVTPIAINGHLCVTSLRKKSCGVSHKAERGWAVMTRIDLENHFAATGWLEAVRRNDIKVPEWAISMFAPGSWVSNALTDLGEGRIKLMDEAGIDVAVLSPVSYTHLRAHETDSYLVCRLL